MSFAWTTPGPKKKGPLVDYIIKWNPRKQDRAAWLDRGLKEGAVSTPRPGKRVALFSFNQLQEYEGEQFSCRLVVRVIERSIDKHGTSEQFHSEFKTDMNLERLPSGKFATNALIMSLAGLAYNILRFVGQLGILGDGSPIRHSAQR